MSNTNNIDSNEQPWIAPDVKPKSKPLRALTGKEKAFADYLIKYPKATQAQAIEASYVIDGMTDQTMKNMASRIKNRPPVLAYLEKHSSKAQRVLTEVMEYSNEYGKSGTKEGAMYATVAERTANSLLDRVHGKARQTVDVTSTSVNLSIDLGNITE